MFFVVNDRKQRYGRMLSKRVGVFLMLHRFQCLCGRKKDEPPRRRGSCDQCGVTPPESPAGRSRSAGRSAKNTPPEPSADRVADGGEGLRGRPCPWPSWSWWSAPACPRSLMRKSGRSAPFCRSRPEIPLTPPSRFRVIPSVVCVPTWAIRGETPGPWAFPRPFPTEPAESRFS